MAAESEAVGVVEFAGEDRCVEALAHAAESPAPGTAGTPGTPGTTGMAGTAGTEYKTAQDIALSSAAAAQQETGIEQSASIGQRHAEAALLAHTHYLSPFSALAPTVRQTSFVCGRWLYLSERAPQ